jgi:hypothetical protein
MEQALVAIDEASNSVYVPTGSPMETLAQFGAVSLHRKSFWTISVKQYLHMPPTSMAEL